MVYQVVPLAGADGFGAEVRGLTRADLAREDVREALRRLWVDAGVIVFRCDTVDSDFQIELSRVFGPLEKHTMAELHVDGRDELVRIGYRPEAGIVYEVKGEPQASWIPFHSDLTYVERINHGGILRAITLPSRGGQTRFIDRIAAYQRLPDDLKERIEDLRVVYRMKIMVSPEVHRYTAAEPFRLLRAAPFMESVAAREDADYPPVTHPLVYRQPETGRKVLNLSPLFAMAVEGMDPAESHELLTRLSRHLTSAEAIYEHQWGYGDMVLWDNWRIVHGVSGSPVDEVREMWRTTIEGDYALGRRCAEVEGVNGLCRITAR